MVLKGEDVPGRGKGTCKAPRGCDVGTALGCRLWPGQRPLATPRSAGPVVHVPWEGGQLRNWPSETPGHPFAEIQIPWLFRQDARESAPWEPFCCGSDMFSPFSLAFVFCTLGLGPLPSLEYRKLVFCAGKQQSGAQDGNLSGWFFTTVRPFALLICLRIYKSEEILPRVCPAPPTENTGSSRLPVQPCPLQTASHRQPEVILRREVSLVICFRGALG